LLQRAHAETGVSPQFGGRPVSHCQLRVASQRVAAVCVRRRICAEAVL
jgi:hypothetical protein